MGDSPYFYWKIFDFSHCVNLNQFFVLHCIMAFLCIDIGGTNTFFGVGDDDFRKVKEIKTADFLSDINKSVKSVLEEADYPELEKVAVAAAGPIDKDKGLFYPPNIDKEFVQLKDPLEEFAEVEIINDCAAAVLGEYYYGETAENLLYITISSGIGAAFISNGDLVEGRDGNFGEVGHMKIGEELECGCGGTGHWEAYCSGNNLTNMAHELHDLEIDDPKELFEVEGENAEEALDEFKHRTCVGVANLINLYNPDKIIFGGAVALNHFDTILESIENGVKSEIVNEMPEMTLCGLGEIAVLHGLRVNCNGKVKE
ncbi:ROK family protein [Candidatus Nanohalobium constans]|uniref:Glucokinase n=1 Tax=Candidatus Nanohalobium constans TaxID=2565781 RepID=A0A5Q0UHG0_9ARCH|nr:ROK family protein [Candidatus Nanohalobium constans]QGA81024.1 glucokinase [Candidatus Nanohalobium constans]